MFSGRQKERGKIIDAASHVYNYVVSWGQNTELSYRHFDTGPMIDIYSIGIRDLHTMQFLYYKNANAPAQYNTDGFIIDRMG